jgi:hypothetical protein
VNPPLETKAAPPPGLPPHLEQAVREHRLTHFAEPVCPLCAMSAKDGNTVNGRCPHRPGPAEAAERHRWQAKAAAVRLVQELESGMLGTGSVPIVDVGRAAQEDAQRAAWHQAIEDLFDAV